MVHRARVKLRPDLHYLTDWALGALMRGGLLYADGFGDLARLEELVERVRRYPGDAAPAEIEIRFDGRPRSALGYRVQRGTFDTPMAELLPEASKRGHVELLLPPEVRHGREPRLCLMLAATAEEGYARRRLWATSLLRHGIGALILENPYYGRRRPAGQLGPSLRTVADQFTMNLVTVDEANALLSWMRRRGHERVGVTGYSQGGMMAAFAAAMVPFPVAAVPRGAGSAAGPIFTTSALTRAFDWDRLAADKGGREEARAFFLSCLEPVNVSHHGPPRAPEAAILMGARSDGFIPPRETEHLHRHWKGSELRWLPAGHVTSLVLHRRAQLRAIRDAFDRLDRALG